MVRGESQLAVIIRDEEKSVRAARIFEVVAELVTVAVHVRDGEIAARLP